MKNLKKYYDKPYDIISDVLINLFKLFYQSSVNRQYLYCHYDSIQKQIIFQVFIHFIILLKKF